jgi:ABC-type phosphate/phosphonate transport system substrate-binding protein
MAREMMLIALLVFQALLSNDAQRSSGTIHVGIVKSLFHGAREPAMQALMKPFGLLVESQTGLNVEVEAVVDPIVLARQLAEHRIQIGVFNGVEFAWTVSKYPSFQPVVIAINQQPYLRACLVVRAESKATGFGSLRGSKLDFSPLTRLHCHMYLERQCALSGQPDPHRFFSPLHETDHDEEALDDVVDRLADGAVVDEVALKRYKRRKPSRMSQLNVLDRSSLFPASVIVCDSGTFDRGTLQQLRKGLLEARNRPFGIHLMTMWKMTAFEPVPDNYARMLADISKIYPSPERSTAKDSAKK